MHTVSLKLPVPPGANRYWQWTPRGIAPSKAARAYKQTIAKMLLGQVSTVLADPLKVSVRIYRPRRSGDLDGYLKCLLDACNRVVWEDDKQVVELHAYRDDCAENPRVELVVETVADVLAPEPTARERRAGTTLYLGGARLSPAVRR
jgi:crossover junction endodeoxyribonuclease RusA